MSQLVVTNADKAEWKEIKNVNITIPTDPNPELQNEVKQIYVADKNGNNKIGIWDKYLQYNTVIVDDKEQLSVSEREDINKDDITEFSMLIDYFGEPPTEIAANTCKECNNLTKITIDNIQTNPIKLKSAVFKDCKNATSLVVNGPIETDTSSDSFFENAPLLTSIGPLSNTKSAETQFALNSNNTELDYKIELSASIINGPPFTGSQSGNINDDQTNGKIIIPLSNDYHSPIITQKTIPKITKLQVMPHSYGDEIIVNQNYCTFTKKQICEYCNREIFQEEIIHDEDATGRFYDPNTWEIFDRIYCPRCGEIHGEDYIKQGYAKIEFSGEDIKVDGKDTATFITSWVETSEPQTYEIELPHIDDFMYVTDYIFQSYSFFPTDSVKVNESFSGDIEVYVASQQSPGLPAKLGTITVKNYPTKITVTVNSPSDISRTVSTWTVGELRKSL